MTAKVSEVTETAAGLKSRVDTIEKGGESLAPGYAPPEQSADLGRADRAEDEGEALGGPGDGRWGAGSIGALCKGPKSKRKRRKKTGEYTDGEGDETPVWFEGLSALSDTDRRVVETTSGGLRRRFAAVMGEFHALRFRVREDYKHTVARRYYAVTGRDADAEALERMADTGEGEEMLSHAVRDSRGSGRKDSEGAAERGMAQVQLTLDDVRRRRDAVVEVEEGMLQLHQIFLDMATLVEQQGDMLDNIEVHVARSAEYTQAGARALVRARALQRKSRRKMWIILALVFGVAIVVALIVLAGFRPF